jgi:hypothetical protein
MKSGKLWMAVAILLASSVAGVAQTSPDLEQGMKPYGSYHGGAIDSVSLTNQNLTLHAPLFAYSQRGGELAFPVSLLYNNKVFSIQKQGVQCAPGTPLESVPQATFQDRVWAGTPGHRRGQQRQQRADLGARLSWPSDCSHRYELDL